MDISGVDVEIDVIKEYPELEDLVVNPSLEDQNFNSSKYGFKSVKINAIKGEELDLNPTTEQQSVEGVFTKVKVNAIKTQKLNTIPSTQEQVITGLFDEVTVNAIEGQELNLNPSEEQQSFEGVFLGVNMNPIQVEEITTDLDFSSSDAIELTAQEGSYIKKAIINKDTNLTSENIKSGVTVCGVSGDVADTSDADATSDDIVAGKSAYVNNQKVVGTYDNKLKTDNPIEISGVVGNVQIKIDGKNKFDQEDWYNKLRALNSTGMQKKNVDGKEYFRINPAYVSSYQYMKGMFKEKTQYTISCKGRAESFLDGVITGFRFIYTDGTNNFKWLEQSVTEHSFELVSEKEKTIDYIDMPWGYGEYALMRDIQLVEGTEVSPYTKFKDGDTYTFDIEDGDKFEISLK